MGGGFGSKLQAGAEAIVCAKLAQMAKVPVKLLLDRKEEHLDTGNRPSARAKIKAGVAADGMLTAFEADSWGTGGAGQGIGQLPIPYIYTFPNRKVIRKDVYINAGTQRPMRAPGHPQGCFLTEVLMDELADRVRMDPVEFRIKNLPAAGAERDVPGIPARGSQAVRVGQAPPDRRSDAWADQDRLWLFGASRGAAAAAVRRRTATSWPTARSS